jgi:hypothetical protein
MRNLLLLTLIASLSSLSGAQVADNEAKLTLRFPGWRNAIISSEFKIWLSKQPNEITKLAKSNDSEDAILLLRHYSKYRHESQPEGYFMLACTIDMIGDLTFEVDTLLVQVNGFAAEIDDLGISFERNGGLWEVNRSTGSVRVKGIAPEKKLFIYNGQCRKTSLKDRKF